LYGSTWLQFYISWWLQWWWDLPLGCWIFKKLRARVSQINLIIGQIRRDFPLLDIFVPFISVSCSRFGRPLIGHRHESGKHHPYTATDFVDSNSPATYEQPKRRFLPFWLHDIHFYSHTYTWDIITFFLSEGKNVIMSQVIVKCLPNGHQQSLMATSVATCWSHDMRICNNLFLLHYIRKMRPQLSPVEVAGPWRLLGRAESGQRDGKQHFHLRNNQMVVNLSIATAGSKRKLNNWSIQWCLIDIFNYNPWILFFHQLNELTTSIVLCMIHSRFSNWNTHCFTGYFQYIVQC